MPTSNTPPSIHDKAADSTAAVDAFMARLEHPFKAGIEVLREIILAVDPAIAEGIKWNAPSFRTTGYFATTHLRAKQGVGVILHLGAKARALPDRGLSIDDPDKLLKWLGRDRAMVEFTDLDVLKSRQTAFQALLRQWIAQVAGPTGMLRQ
jgi:hypothetical protein